ncbi:MAG TPA: SMI1/KNR4 family protein [Pirellulales bacterium]|nr:SMI1/KNR4 family protein [Pirellulales bacterium]
MPESFDKPTITRLLSKLRREDRQRLVFGSAMHDYKLNPPTPVLTIEEFEARHGITLPADYRLFITQIGNGGAGPYHGLFPFGELEEGLSWEKQGDGIGDVSQPFRHVGAWNLPASFWDQQPHIPPDLSLEEEERLWAAWDKIDLDQYFNPAIMNGAIPICHLGWGLRQWLVVNGEQKGFLWDDFRAERGGIRPLREESGRPMTFSAWSMTWLDNALNDLNNSLAQARRKRRSELLTILGLIATGVLLGLLKALWRDFWFYVGWLVAVALVFGVAMAWRAARGRPLTLSEVEQLAMSGLAPDVRERLAEAGREVHDD